MVAEPEGPALLITKPVAGNNPELVPPISNLHNAVYITKLNHNLILSISFWGFEHNDQHHVSPITF
jgi:hypothetical protein